MASTQSVAQKIENTNIQTDNQKNYTLLLINLNKEYERLKEIKKRRRTNVV